MSQLSLNGAVYANVEKGPTRTGRLVCLSALSCLLALIGSSALPGPARAQAPAPAAAEIVRLTNVERQRAGLPALQSNGTLTTVAQDYAALMARLKKMAHDLDGNASDRLARAGYGAKGTFWWGENIAYGYPSSDAVVKGWMASPGHRANILNTHFTQVGVGVAFDSNGVPYYCQVFARPPGR